MERIVVPDALGVRWTVRARRLRRGQRSGVGSGPEQDSLRRRLAGVLAPHPLVVHDPFRGTPGGWRTPGDTSDIALRETWRSFGDGGAPVQLWRLVSDTVAELRTPWSDTWRLEAVARGRIRRWAIWEVEGAEATERAIPTVAAALEAGNVPQPRGAVLVEVVDQRPPERILRSAGLGRRGRVG